MKPVKFSFEDLKLYQKALTFIDDVYDVTAKFPKNEEYRLTSQFIRAVQSIAFNIAEGSGDTNAQFSRFLRISRGSLKECVVCITIAYRRNYVDENQHLKLREQAEELSKMINGLIKYLK
ncbi:MAG: four helix bundle protein [Polaribacter sp.]|nr:four helix bundle protein [Polaribacter sp.]